MFGGDDRVSRTLRRFMLWGVLSLIAYLIFSTEVTTVPGSFGDVLESTWVPVLITLTIGFILFAPDKWAKAVKGFFGLVILSIVLYWILF
jgi:hypothetical protein